MARSSLKTYVCFFSKAFGEESDLITSMLKQSDAPGVNPGEKLEAIKEEEAEWRGGEEDLGSFCGWDGSSHFWLASNLRHLPQIHLFFYVSGPHWSIRCEGLSDAAKHCLKWQKRVLPQKGCACEHKNRTIDKSRLRVNYIKKFEKSFTSVWTKCENPNAWGQKGKQERRVFWVRIAFAGPNMDGGRQPGLGEYDSWGRMANLLKRREIGCCGS